MARAIWTGSLTFGLVNVPVGLFAATEDKSIHFNQFQAGTSDRIRYQRVNERTGKEVDRSDIVRGHEIGDGDYVLVTDEELDAVQPGRSRTIEISDFVDLADIDPVYFQRAYYLAPQSQEAEHAYAVLRQAMAATGKAGIASFVMRGKEYLVTVRPDGDVLALETMYFADEVRDPQQELERLPSGKAARDRELDIAKQLIESMATSWNPENYRDTYREQVEEMIERKRHGEEVVTESEPPEEATVVDLMDALRRSAEAARGGKGSTGKRSAGKGSAGKGSAGKGSAGKEAAGKGSAGRDGSGGDDLGRMSKTELAKLASDLRVPGRSKMSREELAAAVGRARRGKTKTA